MRLNTIWKGAQHVFGIKIKITDRKRSVAHVRVRWLAMYAAKRRGYNYSEIARFFDGMEPATVRHGVLGFEKQNLTHELQELETYLLDPIAAEQPATLIDLRERLIRVEKLLEKPVREKLPDSRDGLTHHFTLITRNESGGVCEVDGYIQTGVYPTGKLGEVFIKTGKAGEASAVLDQYAIMFSIALQYGAPVEDLCNKGIGTRFEPSGATKNPEIPRCTSLVDYAARWLMLKYGKPVEALTEDSTYMYAQDKS